MIKLVIKILKYRKKLKKNLGFIITVIKINGNKLYYIGKRIMLTRLNHTRKTISINAEKF